MRNWADLLPEVLDQISKRLISFEDFISFGGVCSTWRRVAIQQNYDHPLQPLPWLMLAENENNKEGIRDFYSLTKKKIYSLVLPELKGKKCIETNGWLVTSSEEGEMSLFQPMTRQSIPLPHMNTFKYYKEHHTGHLEFVTRAVLSSNPNSSEDCVLMVIIGGVCHLAFCRPGDTKWKTIEYRNGTWKAIEYHRGKFFAINTQGVIWKVELRLESDYVPEMIRFIHPKVMTFKHTYLVVCSGKLLTIFRGGIEADDYHDARYKFWVYEVDDRMPTQLKKVKDLGTKAIFLGHSATLCVETSYYIGLCPNSIYFTDDSRMEHISYRCPKGGGKAMGIFDLSNRTWSPHYHKESLSKVCPPIWTFLTIR